MPNQKPVTNPRIVKLIELEAAGRIRPEHQTELDSYRARGILGTPKQLTESEAKTTNFYNSALGAENEWKSLEADPELAPGTQPVGMLGDVARAVLPANVVNSNTSPARQRAQQAKENFIRASLRLESGAAIGKEEFDRQDRIFFPQTGNSPDVLAQKARARQTVIEGFKIGSGPGARQVDRLREDDPAGRGVEITASPVVGGFKDELPAEPMSELKDEDKQAYFALARTARSPGELVGFMADRGFMMDPARAKAIIEFRDKHGKLSDTFVAERPKPVDLDDGVTGATLRGVGDSATFGGLDELGGVVDTLGGKGGDGSFTDRLYRNIDYNRAVMEGDEENHPVARVVGQLAGGVAIPLGAGARTAAQLARVGAIGGAAYGFGSGEGNALQRIPDALGGAAVGAVGGYASGRAAPVVGNALARFRPTASPVRAEANALAQAAGRQDVPMMAADLRPGARNINAFLEASPGGSGPVQDALAVGNDALESAVGRVGGGSVQAPEAIGSTIQAAGRRMIDRTRQIKNDLYSEAERMAPTTTVRSQSAVDALDRNIAELAETPNANRGLLQLLNDMRDDLVVPNASTGRFTPRGLSIASIRNMRTAMRGEIGSRNLTMTDAERRVSQVIDAASTDITTALSRTDPRAASAYRRADQYYAQRQQYIRDVVQHYTGPRDRPFSGEQAYHRVIALTGTKGDRERLAAVMRGLNPDERADVASTVAAGLGRRTPDDDFSPARFVTQAEKMTRGARQAIFGTDGADTVDDLIRIAAAKRDTGNSLNRSRSGQVGAYNSMLTGALGLLGAGGGYAATGGAGGAALGAVAAGAMKAGALNVSARLLTNRQFVSWLGRAPNTATPAQITAHVRQLSNIAIREPMIRGELEQLQRMLSQTSVRPSLAADGAPGNEQEGDRRQAVAAGR
jgi:hypothetical protein